MAAIRLRKLRLNTILSALFSIPVVLIAMVFHHMPSGNIVMLMLTIPVLALFGREFYIIAWKRMLHFSANMDTLVALGTGSAFLFSAFNTLYPEFLRTRGLEPHVNVKTFEPRNLFPGDLSSIRTGNDHVFC